MKLKCTYVRAHGHLNSQREQVLELDGVVLDGAVDTREILPQLDMAVIAEWMAEQGYLITNLQGCAA